MSLRARQLIEENIRTRSPFLDLADCGLRQMPPELAQLEWLESLTLSSVWTRWDGRQLTLEYTKNSHRSNSIDKLLGQLPDLPNLRLLALERVPAFHVGSLRRFARLEALTLHECGGINGTELEELTQLRALSLRHCEVNFEQHLLPGSALQALDLLFAEMRSCDPLRRLTELRFLDLSHSDIGDLRPIAGLARLETLLVGGTQIVDLAPLAALPRLRRLEVASTEIKSLQPVARMPSLEVLDVAQTKVHSAEPLLALPKLKKLGIGETPIVSLRDIARLSTLEELDISSLNVGDLAPLAALTKLEALTVWGVDFGRIEPICSLPRLRTLSAGQSSPSDWKKIAALRTLRELDVRGARFRDTTPLAAMSQLEVFMAQATAIRDIGPLAGLGELRDLNLRDTNVEDVTPLRHLTKLTDLHLKHTRVADVSALANLRALKWLSLSGTPVSDVGPLSGLPSLEMLILTGTQVASIAPLAGIRTLRHVDVSGSQVTDLSPLRALIANGVPVYFEDEEDTGTSILVQDCRLNNPPTEIVAQGSDAILNYFREREKAGVHHLYEAKMLILGEGGAGKTSLVRRLYRKNLPLPAENESTRGIDIHRHDFKLPSGETFRLNVWDFGGQEIYHTTHQFFLTHRSLYVLLDDTRKDHRSVSDEGFKYWLELIEAFGGASPVILFQNEKGGRSKSIDLAGIQQRFANVKECHAGNLDSPGASDRLREAIEYYARTLSHVGEELPARWLDVRADIEARAREIPYISRGEYFRIYSRHMEPDRERAHFLSRYFHDLGIFLHFQDDPLLGRTVILQNEWATEAVFRILDDEAIKARLGRFGRADCERLWRDSCYSEMHPELLALMQKFELCYELPDSSPITWLAPQLLPAAKSATLADWPKPDDLVLRYKYVFMPKGLVSRLMVRLHRFVPSPELASVTTVLFTREQATVLVQVLPEGRAIEMRARGHDRKALLNVVAAHLDELNNSFSGVGHKVEKLIPCNCPNCASAASPEFYEQTYLLKRVEHHRERFECRTFSEVDAQELLDGVKVERLPAWAEEARHAHAPRRLRIFLASSAELRGDRDEIELYLRQRNDHFLEQGIYISVHRWEHFLDAMSAEGLQAEYNKAIRQCDVFLSLFFTRTGKYTEEEFDVAHTEFLSRGSPAIYTFFKQSDGHAGGVGTEGHGSLLAFQNKLSALKHYWTRYENIEHLKRQFRDQLDMLINR